MLKVASKAQLFKAKQYLNLITQKMQQSKK